MSSDYNFSNLAHVVHGMLMRSIYSTLNLSPATASAPSPSVQSTSGGSSQIPFEADDLPPMPTREQIVQLQSEIRTASESAEKVLTQTSHNMQYLRSRYGEGVTIPSPADASSNQGSNQGSRRSTQTTLDAHLRKESVSAANNKITLKVKKPNLGKDSSSNSLMGSGELNSPVLNQTNYVGSGQASGNVKGSKPIARRSGENGAFEMSLYGDGKLTARINDTHHGYSNALESDLESVVSSVKGGSTKNKKKKKRKNEELKLEKFKKKAMSSQSGIMDISSNRSSGVTTPTGLEFNVYSSVNDLDRNRTNLKPAQPNSISPATFWPYVEAFFKAVTEDDIKFLKTEEDNITPFVTPALGKWYTEQWSEEDRSLYPQPLVFQNAEYGETGDGVVPGDTQLPSLVERMYSCLLPEIIIHRENDQDDLGMVRPKIPSKRSKEVLDDVEQRLTMELQHLGLLCSVEGTGETGEDEISLELRRLQGELRVTTDLNSKRKKILADIATEWLGWEEYNELIDDINKKLIEEYSKKFKSSSKSKAKKKTGSVPSRQNSASDLAATGQAGGTVTATGEQSGAAGTVPTPTVIDNSEIYRRQRQRIIDLIGVHLRPEKFTIPEESIYKSLEPEVEVEDDEDDDEDDDDEDQDLDDNDEDDDEENDGEEPRKRRRRNYRGDEGDEDKDDSDVISQIPPKTSTLEMKRKSAVARSASDDESVEQPKTKLPKNSKSSKPKNRKNKNKKNASTQEHDSDVAIDKEVDVVKPPNETKASAKHKEKKSKSSPSTEEANTIATDPKLEEEIAEDSVVSDDPIQDATAVVDEVDVSYLDIIEGATPEYRPGLSVMLPDSRELLLRQFALEILLSNQGNAVNSLLTLLSGDRESTGRLVERAWGNALRTTMNAKLTDGTVEDIFNGDSSKETNDDESEVDAALDEDEVEEAAVKTVSHAEAHIQTLSDDIAISGGIDPEYLKSQIQEAKTAGQGMEGDYSKLAVNLGISMESIQQMSNELTRRNSETFQKNFELEERLSGEDQVELGDDNEVVKITDDIMNFPKHRTIVLMGEDTDRQTFSDRQVVPLETEFINGMRVRWSNLGYKNFPKRIRKYEFSKYLLNHQIDDMYLDVDGWFSITPEAIASAIVDEYCGDDWPQGLIVDGFAGVGGNTILFASQTDRHVVGIEWDATRLACAKSNAVVYNVPDSKIDWISADILNGIHRTKAKYLASQNNNGEDEENVESFAQDIHLWHFSPPWGGPEYLAMGEFKLKFLPVDMKAIINAVISPLPGQTEPNNKANMIFFLPRTTSDEDLIKLTPPGSQCEIATIMTNNRGKAKLAIYGDIASAE